MAPLDERDRHWAESTGLNTQTELATILDDVLTLGGRGLALGADSRLMGALPELDSMAVVSVLEAIQQRFDIRIADDDIDGRTFATLGSLTEFVSARAGR